MNANEILRIVDSIHRDKAIDKEIVFGGVEQAIYSALRKYYGDDEDITVVIDRSTGIPSVTHNGEIMSPDDLGRIAAQTAKQVMIQKIREAERDALYDEYTEQRGQLVSGTITRFEGGVAIVNLGKIECLLPRSEQIPGESHRVNERIRAVILDVRKSGSRLKLVLSRVHPEFVRRLFEVEIPEVSERIIEVRSLAREAGHRSKVAVSCIDNNIDAVGACVGVRGARIKNIIDELHGERIDIVRWNDSLQILIPNALQPAEIEDVILCPMLGRVIVLVRDDQLSLAIGKRGQNVRLGSKLVGWNIEVMTREELDNQLDRSVQAFANVPHLTDELAETLVSQGFFSFDDLSVIEPDQLAELGTLTEEQVDEIIAYADDQCALEEQQRQQQRAEGIREGHRGGGSAAATAVRPAVQTAPSVKPPSPSVESASMTDDATSEAEAPESSSEVDVTSSEEAVASDAGTQTESVSPQSADQQDETPMM